MSTKVGSGHLFEHFRIICERMAMFVGYSRSLSVSLVPRPCRRRESGLVSTACTCANIPRKAWEIVIFTIAWIISRHNIQGLVYICTHTLEEAAMLFCWICHSEVQPKYSTALFSDVRLQEDWPSHLCVYFSTFLFLLRAAMVLLLTCRRSGDAWTETQGP